MVCPLDMALGVQIFGSWDRPPKGTIVTVHCPFPSRFFGLCHVRLVDIVGRC